MSVSIIVGGQYGFEGKDKVACWSGMTRGCDYAVRVTCSPIYEELLVMSSIIPIVTNKEDTTIYVIPSGCVVIKDILLKEICDRNLTNERLVIDPYTLVKDDESNKKMFAKQWLELKDFIGDTKNLLGKAVDEDKDIILEGTSGYGLTSAYSGLSPEKVPTDSTAAGILAAVGLSPLDVDEIILVITAFPITYTSENGFLNAPFDPVVVKESIMVNNPTFIVLTDVNKYDMKLSGVSDLSDKQIGEITKIEKSIDVHIDFIGNGPDTIIDYEKMLNDEAINILSIGKDFE